MDCGKLQLNGDSNNKIVDYKLRWLGRKNRWTYRIKSVPDGVLNTGHATDMVAVCAFCSTRRVKVNAK